MTFCILFMICNRCHYDGGNILVVLCTAPIVILTMLIYVNPGSINVVIRKLCIGRGKCDSMN